jgi:hypothetical protein
MVFFDGITDNGFFRWNHQRIPSVGDSISDSIGDSATSLYGYLSLNPSVISSVKSSDVTTLLHISRQNVYPVGKTVGIYRQNIFIGIYRPFRRRIYVVGIYRQILRWKNFVGNFVDFLQFSGSELIL